MPSLQPFSRSRAIMQDSAVDKRGEKVHFPGATDSYFIHEMKFIQNLETIPTYRVMDQNGDVKVKEDEPQVCVIR